jgi:hypothetical protein
MLTPIKFIDNVRRRLDGPLYQSPNPRTILDRAIDAYRNAVTTANNTGNAWAVNELIITALADTRRYEITAADFSKVLLIASVPQRPNDPEEVIEMSQIEQLPREWAWLNGDTAWYSLWYNSARSIWAAAFRKSEANGFHSYLEFRPTPKAGEQYRVLYQIGDFKQNINKDNLIDFQLPFPELDFYFIALVAKSLLAYTRWSNSLEADMLKKKELSQAFDEDLAKYQNTFDDFIANLSTSDIVYAEEF